MSQATQTLSIEEAEALIAAALKANRVSETVAASVARVLVAAEAEGQVGHGFSRLADYAAQARSGKVDGQAAPSCVQTAPGALAIDAQNGFAFPALDLAVERGIDVAREQGSVSMSISRSHHCGALSVQVDRIAEAGLIGLMVANSPPAIAPWGAAKPVFGTNPIAFAAPRPDNPPLVIDLSLSVVARGKVMHAQKSGTDIPEGWALDADGQPTTDPEAALQGSMVPIGEAKGTALALMVEILAAVFTGAHPSTDVSSFFTAEGPPPGAGQFLMALKPHDPVGFAARLESVLSHIEALEGARLPGTRRLKTLSQAHKAGLAVPSAYIETARALAGATS